MPKAPRLGDSYVEKLFGPVSVDMIKEQALQQKLAITTLTLHPS